MTASLSLNAWREQIGRAMMRLDFVPAADAPFRATVEPLLLDHGLRVARTRMSSGKIFRDASLAKIGEPTRTVLITSSKLEITHQGQELSLDPGEATVLEDFEAGSVGSKAGPDFIAVIVPADGAARSLGVDRTVLARRIDSNQTTVLHFRAFLQMLGGQAKWQSEPGLSDAVHRHVSDLAQLVLGSDQKRSAADHRGRLQALRLASALAFIERHCLEHDLCPTRVAKCLGISVRYLERLLERSGRTFSARVMDLRLVAAHRMLCDSAAEHLRISEIAMRCGFSDLSYFNRRFRERFGGRPSDVRADGMAGVRSADAPST
jgi:AraC-like DNA-binding protein